MYDSNFLQILYSKFHVYNNFVNYYTIDEYSIRVIQARLMRSSRSMLAVINVQGQSAFNIQTTYSYANAQKWNSRL